MGFRIIFSRKEHCSSTIGCSTFQLWYDVIHWNTFPLNQYSCVKVTYLYIYDVFSSSHHQTTWKMTHNDVIISQYTDSAVHLFLTYTLHWASHSNWLYNSMRKYSKYFHSFTRKNHSKYTTNVSEMCTMWKRKTVNLYDFERDNHTKHRNRIYWGKL